MSTIVNHIYSGVFYLDKFAIGKGTKLVVKIPADLEYFKTTTINTIVVMGRITWESMNKRALPNRVNVVVTRHPYKYKVNPMYKDVLFLTPEEAQLYVQTFKYPKEVYIIGGSHVLKLFPNPNKIYITHIIPSDKLVYQCSNIFVDVLNDCYKLIGYSPILHYEGGTYRHLIYINRNVIYGNPDKYDSVNTIYKNLCMDIIDNGENRNDRTGVGTISVFGRQIHIDLGCGFPLLTTKYIPWRHVIEELLWFMRGDTDSKILEKKGVKIWKGNTSREFLDSKGLYNYDEGVLGKGYGWQWRFFGAEYDPVFSDTSKYTPQDGFDQLQYVIDEIKTNKNSRRILMCYWNPCDLDKVALPPCHFACQFYVRQDKYLDCMFSMRSTDVALGLPFNIASYAALLMIIAKKTQFAPGHLIYTGGDVHIYKTHVDSIKQLLTRNNRPLPILQLDESISTKPINDITINDFQMIGYFPHPSIKMPMAI
jgi:thymidylate synthase